MGIEDPTDLLDDLEHALADAGAITFDVEQNKYVRTVPTSAALSLAVEKLALNGHDTQEWFVSAPGKVILFGEHAVVHGVVSFFLLVGLFQFLDSLPRLLDCVSCLGRPSMLWSDYSTERRQAVGAFCRH